MSRLDEEYIMAVVRNRSGIDAGNIDYHLNISRFENLSHADLMDSLATIEELAEKIKDRFKELSKEV